MKHYTHDQKRLKDAGNLCGFQNVIGRGHDADVVV